MPTLPRDTQWLRSEALGPVQVVDRENNILRGYVIAQKGPFKTPGRGEFDDASLQSIVKLVNATPAGLKSRFTHPDMSNDGLGKFLGRAKNARLEGDKARADLHLAQSSFNTPSGNLGGYVLDLAEEDSDALSSSLVLKVDQEYRLEPDGTKKKDEKGNPLPPLWRPTKLHASDIVDTGDAVDGLLSAELDTDALPDALLRRGSELLDSAFPGVPRDVLEARLSSWLEKYLLRRYGEAEGDKAKSTTKRLRRKLKLKDLTIINPR